VHCSGKGEFGKHIFEDTHEFADHKLGGCCGQDGIVTWVCRELESNASKGRVVGSRHDKAEVTMATAAASRGDGMCIGIDFLGEEFEHGIGGCTDEWHQEWVWECKG